MFLSFLEFYIKFCHNLKWKTLQFRVFLCISHNWENSGLQMIGPNALVQSDCRILWSAISVIRHQWKVAYETTNFGFACPDMLSHTQTYLELAGVPLGSLEVFHGKI